MKNIFVTGGSGFVGDHLTERLVQSKYNVVTLIRDEVTEPPYLTKVVHGDLSDILLLERILNEYEIDTAFHLGAQTIVPVANHSPLSTFRSNIEGTWNLLEACRRIGNIDKIVIASSDKAYGSNNNLPYTESSELKGEHPYDVSKSCADLIGQCYHKTYGLPVNIARCGNIYGGGDTNWSRLIPGTIRNIIEKQRPVIRSDGSFIRDYVYVEDIVDAYLLLAKTKLEGEAFNFSNEIPLSVNGVVDKILKAMDSDLKPLIQNKATGEIRNQYLSAEKARKKLGWNPNYTMDAGLLETIKWYRGYLNV